MSGHSKFANIKHRKAAVDAKRAKVFTKIIRELTVSARIGGSDMESNPRLRLAMDKARAANMPKDTMERAIKKGAGELEGVNYEDITYEGYGPGGIAILVETLTDNRNRTVSEVRHIFSKNGGSMGESGSVAWMFIRKGVILVKKSGIEEDTLLNLILEAGGEDFSSSDAFFEIETSTDSFETVKKSLNDHQIEMDTSEFQWVATNTLSADIEKTRQVLKLVDTLEDHDDVQNVYTNLEIDDHHLSELDA